MKIRRIVATSLSVGGISVLLWYGFWGMAFPELWSGYGDHILRVFVLSTIAYFAYRVKPLLFRRW
jgi:hypothetical protein